MGCLADVLGSTVRSVQFCIWVEGWLRLLGATTMDINLFRQLHIGLRCIV